jgi:heme/copper-type cytochrome/quinol oxidase subunit 2
MPGGGAAFLITFKKAGDRIVGVCDIYCGVGHHEMAVTFKVVESLAGEGQPTRVTDRGGSR